MNARPGYAVLGLALLFGRTALADESHTFRLAYDAPPGCPVAETVAAAIQSSSAKAHPANGGEPAIELLAFVTATEGGFLGVLRIRRPDGTETTRGVPAATCAEAASAMTLIAAIAVDPDAAVPAVARPETAATGGDGGTVPDGPAPAREEPPAAPKPAEPASKTIGPSEAGTHSRPMTPESQRASWLGATAGAGIVGAMAPALAPDLALGVAVGTRTTALLSPWIRISAHLAESASVSSPLGTGTARFERLAGRLTGCPVAARVGRAAAPWVLRPCLLFEAGRLRASGSNTPNHKEVPLAWTALGSALRSEVWLAGPFTLSLELGAIFPLKHDSFYFEPNPGSVLHRVGDVGFLGSLEVGLQIL